jgi:hypothetical protein
MAEATRRSVAVKAVWRCEGRRSENALCQRGAFEVETMKNGLILPFREKVVRDNAVKDRAVRQAYREHGKFQT